MPKRHCTEAVVLQRQWLGESNALVTLFCEKLGKIKAVAPGARKSKRRFLGCLDFFSRITVWMVDKGDRMPRLEEAVLLDSHEPLKADLWSIGQAGYFSELVAALIAERDPSVELYRTLNRILSLLDINHLTPIEMRYFELDVLSLTGFGPDFLSCINCNCVSSKVWGFESSQGGVLCASCAQDLRVSAQIQEVSLQTLEVLRELQQGRFPQCKTDSQTMNVLRNLLCRLIDYHVGYPLKSRNFLLQLARDA